MYKAILMYNPLLADLERDPPHDTRIRIEQ